MTQEYTPFLEIIEEAQRLSKEGVTGTLFVATKSNRSAQLMFENGKIVFVYCYNKHGQDALEAMSTIRYGRYRFQAGNISTRRVPLPSTSEILQALTDGLAKGDGPERAQQAQAGGEGLNREQKTVLENVLTNYIGPMAVIICEDHLDTAVDLTAAIEALLAEIPSAEQAQKFKKEVQAALGG